MVSIRLPAAALLLALPLVAQPSWAASLITESEAALPEPTGGLTHRGITRGPTVKLLSPAETKSPFDLKIQFDPHGGGAVDPASVKVVYLRSPTVDLTERIKPYLGPTGIAMPGAEVPAGRHSVRVEVKDSEGRSGTATFELVVGK